MSALVISGPEWRNRATSPFDPNRRAQCLNLINAARKPLGKSLTLECFRYEIDEDARLGRHQRPAGVVDRDRSRVGVPLRHQPHERTALQVPQRASLNELVREL